jgi:hypothetical protein
MKRQKNATDVKTIHMILVLIEDRTKSTVMLFCKYGESMDSYKCQQSYDRLGLDLDLVWFPVLR